MSELLMDTNILLLFVIGNWNQSEIPRFKRTATFSADDFETLQQQTARYQSHVTTPAVLTEVSDLMGNAFHRVIAPTIEQICRPLLERCPPKDQVLADNVFDRLGFADLSVLHAMQNDTTMLTDDVQLYNEALHRGLNAMNFNHLRRLER